MARNEYFQLQFVRRILTIPQPGLTHAGIPTGRSKPKLLKIRNDYEADLEPFLWI
jgi:hypothetical protein